MRKLFSLFVTILVTTSLWAYDFQSGDLYYNITSSSEPYTVEVTYQEFMHPANYSSLTTATIPASVIYNGITYSVTSIGDEAFYRCSSLTSITIPNSVTSIGISAFYGCSSLPVENNLRYADTYLIEAVDKTLSTYSIKEGIKWIGTSAFSGCSSLISITIPNSVTSIGNYAFSICESLTSITVEKGNSIYDSRENCNAVIETATNTLIAGCQNTIIPNSVTSIGDGAFESCCSLTSITIPNSVTSIGSSAFSSCSSLTSVTIGNSVTSIGDHAFYLCSKLTSVTIPNSVTEIEKYAFQDCRSLTSITIPNSITSIGNNAFFRCSSLTSVTINSDAIVNKAYSSSSNISRIFGSQVTKYIIGDEVTGIGNYAFQNCSSLTSIIIPNSVVSIGEKAFYYCPSLTSVTCEAITPPILGANVFDKISTITVTCGSIEDYMASDWVTYADALKDDCDGSCGDKLVWKYEDSQLNILGEGDMYDYDVDVQPWQQYRNKITSISLPEGMTSIGNAGFKDCMFVNHVNLPASVETIGFSAFENCRMLSNLTFAANGALTIIDNWAFYNNHELKNVVIPEGVTSIGYAAFYGCTYLSELTLPASMQAIEDNGFALCAKLQRMNVDAIVPPIVASRTFEDVDRTIPVVVPDESVSVYKSAPVWQEFNIQGKSEVPTALDNIHAENSDTRKLLRDGQLLILRDGKTYTIMGAEIH